MVRGMKRRRGGAPAIVSNSACPSQLCHSTRSCIHWAPSHMYMPEPQRKRGSTATHITLTLLYYCDRGGPRRSFTGSGEGAGRSRGSGFIVSRIPQGLTGESLHPWPSRSIRAELNHNLFVVCEIYGGGRTDGCGPHAVTRTRGKKVSRVFSASGERAPRTSVTAGMARPSGV